ncbi:MAG: glycosyltransferase [Syntrophaceae bacterium]|nr:glycosyltransferase [Syntrophaceae bacterium]
MSNVCAIILDYFGSDKTIRCLSSLLDQGLDTVMIVDNSGDQKANIQLRNELSTFSQNSLPFTIHQIVNQQNLGYAKGVNNALRWLENTHPHRYYLLINNDTEATPGMLQKLLTGMHENKRTVLTSPIIDTGLNKMDYLWYHRLTGLMFSHYVFGTFPYLTGCSLLVDRHIIKDGLFDEDFFMYGEDVELCRRLQLSGWNISCLNQATVRHEGVGSSRQGNFFYEYYVARGHMILAKKLAVHVWETPFLYLGRLLTLSLRSIVRAIRFRSFVPIKAWISALRKNNNMTR